MSFRTKILTGFHSWFFSEDIVVIFLILIHNQKHIKNSSSFRKHDVWLFTAKHWHNKNVNVVFLPTSNKLILISFLIKVSDLLEDDFCVYFKDKFQLRSFYLRNDSNLKVKVKLSKALQSSMIFLRKKISKY